jgi:ribosomal protein S18 acetylase RimI-like enzyme
VSGRRLPFVLAGVARAAWKGLLGPSVVRSADVRRCMIGESFGSRRVRDDTGKQNREGHLVMKLAEPVRLAEAQVAASGAVLARAFANDPFFTHVLSDSVEREGLMPPLMEAWTRYGLLFGEVYVTAGPIEASAIWLAPGARTEERRGQAGLTAVVSAFSDGARARYDAIVQHQGRIREAVPSVPHWHLPFIGVDPARQGLGLGSLLLRKGLSRVDQDRVECRLFTDEPRNVPLYLRHGFEIAAEGDVLDGGPHVRYMRRRPHPITP